MTGQDPKGRALVLVLIFWAFVLLPVMLTLLILPRNIEVARDRPLDTTFVAVCVFALLAGVAYSVVKLSPKDAGGGQKELPSYERFQSDMLVALAFLELCTMLAVFIIANEPASYFLAGASVLAMLTAVLPNVMRYCRVLREGS